ncbi:MAG: hypothetical protein IT431_06705 [Phycisphaerales bacterium]|nr:hypothetical protein [Phycisphaerales bacterium]
MTQRAFVKIGEPGRRAGLLVLALLGCLAVVAMLGSPLMPGMAIGALTLKLGAVWPAAVYLAAGFGLGWPVVRMLRAAGRRKPPGADQRGSTQTEPGAREQGREAPVKLSEQTLTTGTGWADSAPIQAAAGLAVIFSLSEVLGVLGLLNAPTAIGVCAVGLGLLGWQATGAVRAGARIQIPGLVWMLACPAVAVLLVAAVMPPGWLWASEYGGFDALSYHLQLPQEWLASGRVEPVEHNVYSYLPGYVEAAFTHLGWMTLAPERGLPAGDGWRLLACQALHAGLTLIAAWLTARATQRLAMNLGAEERIARWAGAIAGCVALATPWAVVTGSLAYNEAGVNAMLAGALLVGVQPGLRGSVRGGLVGLLVGVACGFKPTALLFAGVPAGAVMVLGCAVGAGGRKAARAAVVVGAIVGLLALSPWLARNAAHAGNPVFPFATDTLGAAHWTPDQVQRYGAAHSGAADRAHMLRLLAWDNPNAAPGAPAVERFRGLANPQWGLASLFVALAIIPLIAGERRARGVGLVLLLVLWTQLACWLGMTHMQSRFLLPLLPVGAMVIGLGLARLRTLADARPDGRAGVALLGGTVVLVQTGFLVVAYTGQRAGGAGEALPIFPEFFTGLQSQTPAETSTGWCNLTASESARVYLLGDSTPLYYGTHVVYHTTYDASPLGGLMRAHPDDPAAWSAGLRERGIAWLLVNESELRRLAASGWYDPEVTAEAVHRFVEQLGGPEFAWPDGRYAVRLPGAGGDG